MVAAASRVNLRTRRNSFGTQLAKPLEMREEP